ncbi:ankyrin repeat protein [Aspergillus udagawae]|nr:ankyrin repeat protein [Aspergillus udagawae]
MSHPARECFQIGWICALPIEQSAAEQMLDENFGILEEQDREDPNVYTLGRIGAHYVVIACLPEGQYGIASATLVASHMTRTFSKSLRIGLMVGVGGGIPSAAHDIRLGDIVISRPQGTCGGVLQYDMGKIGDGGKLRRTGSLNSLPRSLLAAVTRMISRAYSADPSYPEYIRYATERTARTRGSFGRPSPQSDRLFKIEYDHPPAADDCDRCLAEWEEMRGVREDSNPKTHYGIIASGNAVIKHGRTRERLRLETGALCFEMEAAGLMLDFPCIIIRGICDYADSHKNDKWKGYAALAAAAYAKELLTYVPRVSHEGLAKDAVPEMVRVLKSLDAGQNRIFHQQEQYYGKQERRALTDRQQCCHKLFGQQPDLLRHALPPWEKSGEKIQNEVDELWRILIAATSDPASSSVICVLDALDECRKDDRLRLIQKLGDFYYGTFSLTQKAWMKFLVTSRPYIDIEDNFRSITDCFPCIHLRGEEKNSQIREEINNVVKIRVKELSKDLQLSLKTHQRLEQQLLQMNHRTYLWLDLAIDDIRATFRNSLRPDEESIQLIPTSVNAAYEKILLRVTPDQMPTVNTIFQIIVGARRPLTIDEMAMALGVATKPHLRTATEACLNSEGLGEKIRHLCGLFVFIDHSKIYLMHQTAREFLIGKTSESSSWHFDPSNIECRMAQICIRCLLMKDLESKRDSPRLLRYAAEHWADHVQKIPSLSESELKDLVYEMYDTTTAQFRLWYPIFWKAVMPYTERPTMNIIHLAAFNGHKDVVKKFIAEFQTTIDQTDNKKMNALTWASLRGHRDVVELLLENGANVNTPVGIFGNALHASSSQGHDTIAQLLLERGADVNAESGEYGTALQAAASQGHDKTVKTLLEWKANVNAESGEYGTALQTASSRGYDHVVMMLLKQGATVNTEGGFFGTALAAASYSGHDKIVELLLNWGADINAPCGLLGSALQAASSQGHDTIVRRLLKWGADVNARGGEYGSALRAASYHGHDNILLMLLDAEAEINAPCGLSGNALHAAASQGHDKTVKTLLEWKANVNAQGGEYGTALQAASSQGHVRTVETLLKWGADINAPGGEYGNALGAASYNGHDKIVSMLLDRGANVDAQCGFMGNALQAANSQGHHKIVQMLLEKGCIAKPHSTEHGFFGISEPATRSWNIMMTDEPAKKRKRGEKEKGRKRGFQERLATKSPTLV